MDSDFDPVSAKSVSALVALTFDPSLPSPITRNSLNSSEKRWVDRVVMMLRGAEAGELSVREKVTSVKEDLGEDSDIDWDFEEPSDGPKSQRHLWTKEMMGEAYTFYRSGQRKRNREGEGCRSLAVMTRQFAWIKDIKDIKAITLYGKTGVMPTNRNAQLQLLAVDLDREVTALIDAGAQFHDCNVQELALSINEEKNYWPAFKASEGWIQMWKNRYRDKEATMKKVEELQQKVKKEIAEEHPDICCK